MKLKTEHLSEGRDTRINWPNLIKGIVDGYTNNGASITHATQKDGIQNSVDAFDPLKPDEHHIKISLVMDSGSNLLIFEDFGTFGLTGRVLGDEDMKRDLPVEERWGRFENLAFTKDTEEKTLGARGQGKFMLLAASDKMKFSEKGTEVDTNDRPFMLYDTLRADGVYRLGLRTVETTRSPIHYWEGEEARQQLKTQTEGILEPIDHVGTRVIIPDVRKEIVRAIKDDKYSDMISTTWFPLLRDNPLMISIVYGEKGKIVMPDKRLLEIPSKDTSEIKVWKSKKALTFNKTKYGLKLHIAALSYESEIASEEIRHVGIYRSGMRVMSLKNKHIPPEIMDRIYGYVEVDATIEKALRDVEDPTHYKFDLSKGLPKKLASHIENELMAFAKDKLGLHQKEEGDRSKTEHEQRKRCLALMNQLSKDLGLLGDGPSVPPVEIDYNARLEPIQISSTRLHFPISGTKRVNFDETLRNISCKVVNNSPELIKGKLEIYAKRLKKVVKSLAEINVTIVPQSRFSTQVYEFSVAKKEFQSPGRYFIAYKFTPDNEAYETKTRKLPFWVEMDPNVSGIFKDLISADFTGSDKEEMTGYAVQEGGDWVFYYNVKHNSYLALVDPVMDLEAHIQQIIIPWFAYIDIRENDPDERKIMNRKVEGEDEKAWELIRSIGMVQSMLYGRTRK